MNRTAGAATVAALALFAGSAQAAKMLAPVSVTTNTGVAGMFWTVDNIIDQSGLDRTYVPGATEFEEYVGTNPRHGLELNTRWLSRENVFSSTLVFDFGQVVTLSKLAFWDDFSTTNSALRLSTPEAVNFATFRPIETTASGATPQVFDFRDVTTRYLSVDIEGCNQRGRTNWTGCGVQEMAFAEGVTGGVPEPATWGLMIMGFGAAGAMLRRRRFAIA